MDKESKLKAIRELKWEIYKQAFKMLVLPSSERLAARLMIAAIRAQIQLIASQPIAPGLVKGEVIKTPNWK